MGSGRDRVIGAGVGLERPGLSATDRSREIMPYITRRCLSSVRHIRHILCAADAHSNPLLAYISGAHQTLLPFNLFCSQSETYYSLIPFVFIICWEYIPCKQVDRIDLSRLTKYNVIH